MIVKWLLSILGMAVLGVLLSFVSLRNWGTPHSSRIKADFDVIEIALALFRTDHGRYPNSDEGLVVLAAKRDSTGLVNWQPYLKREIHDPWGEPYGYLLPTDSPDERPQIFSAGPDRIFWTEDDFKLDWALRLGEGS